MGEPHRPGGPAPRRRAASWRCGRRGPHRRGDGGPAWAAGSRRLARAARGFSRGAGTTLRVTVGAGAARRKPAACVGRGAGARGADRGARSSTRGVDLRRAAVVVAAGMGTLRLRQEFLETVSARNARAADRARGGGGPTRRTAPTWRCGSARGPDELGLGVRPAVARALRRAMRPRRRRAAGGAAAQGAGAGRAPRRGSTWRARRAVPRRARRRAVPGRRRAAAARRGATGDADGRSAAPGCRGGLRPGRVRAAAGAAGARGPAVGRPAHGDADRRGAPSLRDLPLLVPRRWRAPRCTSSSRGCGASGRFGHQLRLAAAPAPGERAARARRCSGERESARGSWATLVDRARRATRFYLEEQIRAVAAGQGADAAGDGAGDGAGAASRRSTPRRGACCGPRACSAQTFWPERGAPRWWAARRR